MSSVWLEYLCDPLDGSELTFGDIALQEEDRVVTGELRNASGHIYEIRQGVPIFVIAQMQSNNSVETFAYEWEKFGFYYAKESWHKMLFALLLALLPLFEIK
jgi:uncharacterized protein YbaR (Trm112 family)